MGSSLAGFYEGVDRAILQPTARTYRAVLPQFRAHRRDAYLQRRKNLIFDGNPPSDKDAILQAPSKPPAQ